MQEPDASAWVCDPPHPAWDTLRTEIVAAYARTGKDFNIGRRVARLLRDAGAHDVQVRATARITKPGDYYHTFLLTISTLLREVIVCPGALTATQFDRCTQALHEHLAAPTTITCQPLIYQAWGCAK